MIQAESGKPEYDTEKGQYGFKRDQFWVIILRRKYIPPFLDIVNDVLILLQNPVYFEGDMSLLEGNNPDQLALASGGEDAEVVGSNITPANLHRDKWVGRERRPMQFIGTIADSITATNSRNSVFSQLIKRVCDSLPFSNEDMQYFKNVHNITPDVETYGYYFIWMICKRVENQNVQTQDFVTQLDNLSFGKPPNTKFTTQNNLIDDYLEETMPKFDVNDYNFKKNDENNCSVIWQRKFLNFLTQCLNGGILPRLNFVTFFKYIYKFADKATITEDQINFKKDLDQMLARFLYLGVDDKEVYQPNEGVAISWGSIISDFNSASSSKHQKKTYFYNEDLLELLMKNVYIFEQFQGDSAKEYLKFVNGLLNHDDTHIKIKVAFL